ncbi:hypothetical protein B4102_3586 [Heyndrickxia sporothermodurans]|uniref:Uncharacterized protein n=1 Tax=Heyndrickxia sporothermodurans TaxID=46224 RepID=A0A150KMJ2_9BACI|nr:hypothetical protein [Heyndrickxia sporothermodurans]KYC94365.1 hypothetical protein B4102_3586 [Heyndrickxia sporothermodurans]
MAESKKQIIDVPIGPAKVEYGDTTPEVFDITKGGVQFQVNTTKQDITVDQFGDTPVKSVLKGRTCQAIVPFALNDLKKMSAVTPNSKYKEDATNPDAVKKRLNVYAQAGIDLLKAAKKLVIKPTSPGTTANDYITIPIAGAMADVQWTYDSDNERICNITFVGYPDADGLLYFLGDEAVIID